MFGCTGSFMLELLIVRLVALEDFPHALTSVYDTHISNCNL